MLGRTGTAGGVYLRIELGSWKRSRDSLSGWQHDSDEGHTGQKGENRKVLQQTAITSPIGLPVIRVHRTTIRPGALFEEV